MKNSGVFIISGAQGQGKTNKLIATVHLLQSRLPGIFGFYAPGEWENGLRQAFRIVDIRSGRQQLLCNREGRTDSFNGSFVFYPAALQQGKQILHTGIQHHGTLAVIDEIGRYELKGKVWHDSLVLLLQKNVPLLITVRDNLAEQIISHFQIVRPVIFSANEPADKIVGTILQKIEVKNLPKNKKG